MFAGTHSRDPCDSRLVRFGDIFVAGWPALAAVASAGLTLGFFAWYALIVPRHHGCLSAARSARGRGWRACVVALAAMDRLRALLFAPRGNDARALAADTTRSRGCRSYCSGSRSSCRRSSRTARGSSCVAADALLRRQSAHCRALQSDRARGADRLRRDAHRDHRHRRARRGDHRSARRERTSKNRRTSCSRFGAAGTPSTISTSRPRDTKARTWRSSRSIRC